MPVHLDNATDAVLITLSSNANDATAVSFDPGSAIASIQWVTNAGHFEWAGDDNTDTSAHAFPVAADTIVEETLPDGGQQSDRQRSCWTVTLDDNPSSGDGFTVTDGTNTQVFRFGAGGDVTVTIGGSAAATLDSLVTDFNGSTITGNAQEHPRTTTRMDVIGTGTVALRFFDIVGDITIEDLGRARQVAYLGSGTASTVVHVLTRGA